MNSNTEHSSEDLGYQSHLIAENYSKWRQIVAPKVSLTAVRHVNLAITNNFTWPLIRDVKLKLTTEPPFSNSDVSPVAEVSMTVNGAYSDSVANLPTLPAV